MTCCGATAKRLLVSGDARLGNWQHALSQPGLTLAPYGLHIGPRLIELARRRLPAHADHFWVGNAWTWRPPRRFRYVYTLHDSVPEALLGDYARRLLERCVADRRRLIAGAYGSKSRSEPARDVSSALRESGFAVAGSASCGEFPVTRIAWLDNQVWLLRVSPTARREGSPCLA